MTMMPTTTFTTSSSSSTTTTTINNNNNNKRSSSFFIGLVALSSFFVFNFETTHTHAFMQSAVNSKSNTISISSNINSINGSSSSSSSSRKTTKLFGYIAADSTDEEFDTKQGGVGLAEDNAIVIMGRVDRKGNVITTDLKRYTTVSNFDMDGGGGGISVICKGSGTELYQNPGLGTDKVITLAPFEAVAEALTSAAEAEAEAESESVLVDGAKKISINFVGGDDLMIHEVVQSVQCLMSSSSSSSSMGSKLMNCSSSIEFRSMCHGSFPDDKCSVVVLAFQGGSSSDVTENVYWHEGQWWTLLEEHLNTAVE